MRLFIDYEKCVGCDLCAMRCSLEKTGKVNPSLSRIRVKRVEEEGLVFPLVCRHCKVPLCVKVCSEAALLKDNDTGLVKVKVSLCNACGDCLKACPYDGLVSVLYADRNIVANCDLCGGNPACVEVCPTGALLFIGTENVVSSQELKKMAQLAKMIKANSFSA